jgi:NTP pyrophosphatase (non-canonical NTP hydrolase)
VITKYRKRPVVIDAIQWQGTAAAAVPIINWILTGAGSARYHDEEDDLPGIAIDTLEGTVTASPGDWIIRGVRGEFYPCKPDIFAATYEPVDTPRSKVSSQPFDTLDPVSITALVTFSHGASVRAGWWDNVDVDTDPHVVPAKLALIHSEISEALEGHRKRLHDAHLPNRPAIEVELADALIRIGDLAGALGLDLGGAVVEKLAYNATRADHKRETRATAHGKAY